MARFYATLDCGIWDDEDGFCTLSAGAQRTYFMLVSQRDIAACGSLALTLRRWSRTCAEKDTEAWLVELIDHEYVLIDEDTEELLVRTFVKWDGGYKHPQRLKAINASAAALRSQPLRTAMAREMQKLGLKPPTAMAQESDDSPTPEPPPPHRLRSEYVSKNHTPETSSLEEGAPAVVDDVEPPEFCSTHMPKGTEKKCGPCGTARLRHQRWVKREARREAERREAASRAITHAVVADIRAAKANAVPRPKEAS